MNYLSSFALDCYLNLIHYALQYRGQTWFKDVDDLLAKRKQFVNYIIFQYALMVLYDVAVSLPSLFYFLTRAGVINLCGLFSSLWLALVSVIALIEALFKAVVIYATIKANKIHISPLESASRLMEIVQSNLFYFNERLSRILVLSYSLYLSPIRRPASCDGAPLLYSITDWLFIGFLLRLVISYANYLLIFKSVRANGQINATEQGDNGREPLGELKRIECVTLTKKNLRKYIPLGDDLTIQACCICLMAFSKGEMVKVMPCNRKHVFHKTCIDKWLCLRKICPKCRKAIHS